MKYSWALNPQKLSRAIGMAGSKGNEKTIKENYIKIGGKVALLETKVNELMTDETEIAVNEDKQDAYLITEVTASETVEVATEPTSNDTNPETNSPTEESQPNDGGESSSDDSVT